MSQYVYTMRRVGKVVPPKRAILKNISLNFFPGAKIGVLALNGAGKSPLLKSMAGVDQDLPAPFRPGTPIFAPGKKLSEMFFRMARLGGTTLPTRRMVYTYWLMFHF